MFHITVFLDEIGDRFQNLIEFRKFKNTTSIMMFLLHDRNIILLAETYILLLLISTGTINCLRNQMRSVETCDTTSEFNLSGLTSNITSCRLNCEKKYINIDRNIKNANSNLARFELKPFNQINQCCCKFETTWPDYVEPTAIGRKVWAKLKTAKTTDCLPLVFKMRLSKRTASSYHVLCNYLNKKIPLTMSELMEFVEVAAYLNYVQPKHPFLYKTLHLKEVKVINLAIQQQLAEIYETSLLNSYKPLEQYDGFKLEVAQIREFNSMMGKLAQALRSRVIARAFDEYIISYTMVDVAAAHKYLNNFNKSLAISERILNEDYDKYNEDAMDYNFKMNDVNCRSLARIGTRLDKYLSNIHSTLGVLYEKLIYEHMSEQYKYLKELIHFKQIYRNILKVNCHR